MNHPQMIVDNPFLWYILLFGVFVCVCQTNDFHLSIEQGSQTPHHPSKPKEKLILPPKTNESPLKRSLFKRKIVFSFRRHSLVFGKVYISGAFFLKASKRSVEELPLRTTCSTSRASTIKTNQAPPAPAVPRLSFDPGSMKFGKSRRVQLLP